MTRRESSILTPMVLWFSTNHDGRDHRFVSNCGPSKLSLSNAPESMKNGFTIGVLFSADAGSGDTAGAPASLVAEMSAAFPTRATLNSICAIVDMQIRNLGSRNR